MDKIEWLEPWGSLCTGPDYFEKELCNEVGILHVLYGKKVSAIGRRYDCDDVLFRVYHSKFNYAAVHLTYSNSKMGKVNPKYPRTKLYKDLDDWIKKCMIPDHSEYILYEEE
ncbi:hypothetical protein N4T77_18060 [Clostridium sp. CX1]|uniref:hypothetical protein n=1 Tax=Clostridium sp. CX1 TaxID=2978346 RepID=UPI0021BE3239|nr:hypothetical protein [Clostridium sp. CX1]MCT8978496.1 hypothetical protein [Clostridium sp. CX1]